MALFTSFAFPTADAGTIGHERTLPARLYDIKNVRDFGATGNGSTDDLAAIMAALNWRTSNDYRGLIYFPPGTYLVSGPIDFGAPPYPDEGQFVGFLGEMGASTVIGNFAGYIFKRGAVHGARWSGGHFIEKLTIINQHANGGGIRLGLAQGGAVRDCDITANIAVNDDNTEEFIDGGNLNGSFEIDVQNCNLRPFNVRAVGSIGLYKLSCGPVINCSFIGFEKGMVTSSGQGASTVHGCYFEGNNAGFAIGRAIETWYQGGGGNLTLSGCHFKNNGRGLDFGGGNCNYLGITIEAATGSIPGNPQYGIFVQAGRITTSTYQGIVVTGAYQQAGVYIQGTENGTYHNLFRSISSSNSAGPAWLMPLEAYVIDFKACNVAPVFTLAKLPAYTGGITSTTWTPALISGTSAQFVPEGMPSDPPSRGYTLVHGYGYVAPGDGWYRNVALTGGSGTGRRANIHINIYPPIVDFVLITVPGTGYGLNDILSAPASSLGGGTPYQTFSIVSNYISGTGYVPGSYNDVPLTGGSGTGAKANFYVNPDGVIQDCSLTVRVATAGTNYVVGDVLGVSNINLGGTGSGFSIRVTAVHGTATVNFTTPGSDWSNRGGNCAIISVAGVTLSGYNGLFTGVFITGGQIEYALVANPGGSSSGGTVFFTNSDRHRTDSCYEGDTYFVNDANTATWGAAPGLGSGTNHVKVRYTPTQWSVIGK